MGISLNLEDLKKQLDSTNSKKMEELHGYNQTIKNLHFKKKDRIDNRVLIDDFVRLKSEPTNRVNFYILFL